jgi:GNAT superfamily N-acetyltransferase
VNARSAPAFTLAPANADDFEALLALRLRAMRDSLTRLGRYDEQRARERLATGFAPGHTRHVIAGGQRVGFIVLKPLSHALRLDHFYIDPPEQRQGIGSQVLRWVCDEADRQLLPVELCALKGSDANRFYLRHGFVLTGEGDWDYDYLRQPTTPSLRTVRALWAAFQARDWAAARPLLHDDLQVTWWTSGERFAGASAFIEVNASYPESWTLRVIELTHLQDGRVLSLLRVDQPPNCFFATSLFRVDDERIVGIDEYWATVEPPPAWRSSGALAGSNRFDPRDDPRATMP